jgi:hypothetical protein
MASEPSLPSALVFGSADAMADAGDTQGQRIADGGRACPFAGMGGQA